MAEITASGTVSGGPTTLYGVEVITNGAADAVVIGYNKPSVTDIAAGNKVFEFTVTSTNNYGGRNWPKGLRLDAGLYVTISGAGASAIIDCS